MNKQTHTEGPWERRGKWIFPVGRDDDIACVSQSYLRSGNEREANALLIAAAPDLLAALKHIDSNAAESVEWIRRVARAAIAKAKGE